jgi:hypothetical protein
VTPEERAALDARLLEAMLLNPTPAYDLCQMIGFDWTNPEHARELRGSLLRMQQEGKVDLTYGRGWFKRPQAA